MKSAFKALKLNPLCYRNRFITQFPTFIEEIKELGLYDNFVQGTAMSDFIKAKDFYDLSINHKNLYNKIYKNTIFDTQQYLLNFEYKNTSSFDLYNVLNIEKFTNNFFIKDFSVKFSHNFRNGNLFSKKTHKRVSSSIKQEFVNRKEQVTQVNIDLNLHDPKLKELNTVRASNLIIKDKIFEEEADNFYRKLGLKDYNDIKYDATQDYIFHETDAKIFAKKQKKERKKIRAQKKQEKLEQNQEKEKKPKNPSFYDLLNIPLELRIAKYDIPLPSEEEEEETIVEYTPIDWDAEDLKFLIIVPHIRDIKFFNGSIGFSFGMYTGNKLLPVAVTEERVGSFLGSFIFTKKLTREIHAKKNKKALKRSTKK